MSTGEVLRDPAVAVPRQQSGPARPSGGPASATAAVPGVPELIVQAVSVAANVVAERSPEPVAVERVLGHIGALRVVLDLLAASAGLRAVTAAQLDLSDPAAAGHAVVHELTGTDADAARQATRAVLKAFRNGQRDARRQARQQARRPPEEVASQRESSRLEDARTARDTARRQAAAAQHEAAGLREQIAELTDEVTTLTGRLVGVNEQLRSSRRTGGHVPAGAEQLAAALTGALTTTPPEALAGDVRGVGPGEPQRITPGRPAPAVETAATTAAQLAAAARTAGLAPAVAEQAAVWLPLLLRTLAAPPGPVAQVRARDLTVDVLGGGTEVGGSCVLVTAAATRLLVDAGSRPGGTDAASLAPTGIARATAAPLDAIVLTHAHNDHCGWVPALIAQQPDVPVITTEATAALLATMWFDSAKVLSRRAVDAASGGATAEPAAVATPVYGRDEVRRALDRLVVVPYGRRHRVGDVEVELFPAGHIVGACGVVVHAGPERVVVSGDVSRPGQRSVGGIVVPDSARGAQVLLLESTYASASKPLPRQRAVADFVRDISATVDAGGRVLVPAFALGRAQEVALVLAHHLPEVEVLVDGLARDVCEVYEQHDGPDGTPLRIFGDRVRAVPRGGTRAELARLRTGVVIATSGMLAAGPAVTWARELLPDPRASVMVVGYQDEESAGARLLALAEHGGGTLELPSTDGVTVDVEVHARVAKYGLGAHASADELVQISADIGADQVMLVHGEPHGQRSFAARLALRSQPTVSADQVWQPR